MPNIKAKNYYGEYVRRDGVNKVIYESADEEGVKIPFTYGEAVRKETVPDFSSGNMEVPIAEGELVTDLTIIKPDELVPENIPEGMMIAGVGPGTFKGTGANTEERVVDLDMAAGDQVVLPTTEDISMSKVTIKKPDALIPGNIANGVDIAGVIGTHETIDYVGRTVSVIYDPTVKGIASYAFYYHTSLMSVNFPNCSAVGSGAFKLCANLQNFSAQNCKRIETNAFNGCSKLIQVYVPDCTLIGGNAFQSCGSLNTVIVGQSSATGGFGDTNGAVHVNASAFYVCSNLASVLDKDGNNALIKFTGSSQSYVFGACRNLEQIGLYSNQYNGIPNNAFSYCLKLSLIESGMISSGSRILFSEIGVMNTSTYGIGVGAFGQCSSITQLKFKTTGGFFKVGDMAFMSCTRLSQLFLNTEGVSSGSSFYSILSRVFSGTPIANSSYLGYYGSIYVPASHVSLYKSSPGWSYYSNRFVAYDFINDKVVE